MGSEIIIPGTPIGSIPPYDRPNFDPRQQNGFLGSPSNLVAPPPGSLVQRFFLNLANQVAVPTNADDSWAATVTLAPGATSNPLSSYQGLGSEHRRYARVTIIDTTAITTSPVAVVGATGNGTGNLVPNVPVEQILDITATKLKNNDTVGHTLTIFVDANLEQSLEQITIDLKAQLGLVVNPSDILRIRDFSLGVGSAGGGKEFYGARCVVRYVPSGAAIMNTSARSFVLDGTFADGKQQCELAIYALRAPVDILGTDFNPSALASSPKLLILLPRSNASGAGNFDWTASGLFDLFVGANQ
ncbi:MAG: hypothetical protein KGJ45_11560 [Elusimicrobia bacterium]|nr:hypothetical protein [Elusimicrobiota bacterium]